MNIVDHPDERAIYEAARLWRRAELDRVGATKATTEYLDAQERGFLETVQDSGRGAWVSVALDGDDVMGVVAGFPVNDQSTSTAYLAYITVDSARRQQGIGLQLVQRAEQRSREAGHDRITLTVHASNEAARALYERGGWSLTGATETTPLDDELLVEYERRI